MRQTAALLSLVLALAAAGPGRAEDFTVRKANRQFDPATLTIKAGDSVTFVNDDEMTHNVYSDTAGQEFDIGPQAPGSKVSHVFTKPGEVMVRCAIHPKMKLKLEVQ